MLGFSFNYYNNYSMLKIILFLVCSRLFLAAPFLCWMIKVISLKMAHKWLIRAISFSYSDIDQISNSVDFTCHDESCRNKPTPTAGIIWYKPSQSHKHTHTPMLHLYLQCECFAKEVSIWINLRTVCMRETAQVQQSKKTLQQTWTMSHFYTDVAIRT